MSECDVPAILEEVSKILRVISDMVKNPADLRRPIPSGWVALGPAKLQPRKPGDKHWSIAAGGWVDTPDDAIGYANRDDWRAIRKVDEDADESSVAKLVEGLAKAMQNDSDLAWTWHCNIAVGSLDEGVCHETANLAAARFMRIAFGVDVTTFDQWKSFLSWEDDKEMSSKTPDHIADANKMGNCPIIPDSSIPDPGEGYRLLSKDPPEGLLDTDEGFFTNICDDSLWVSVNYSGGGQLPLVYYRRKIEAAKEPEYREPTYADLANGPIEVEVCDDKEYWTNRILYVVLHENVKMRFVAGLPNLKGDTHTWKHARIKV